MNRSCFTKIYIIFLSTIVGLLAQNLSLQPEARGIWLDRGIIRAGKDQMHSIFKKLADHHINRVFINVHYFGETIYPSAVIEAAGGARQLAEFAGRDPLAEAIEIARYHGLELVAWFEYGLMAHYSAQDTANSGPIIAAHPDWEAVMANGQHWQTTEFGNFHWLDPGHPQVAQFLEDLFAEITTNYPNLTAIETDRIRYPSQEFSYSAVARQRYMNETGNIDPLLINTNHPQWIDWLDWREQQTTRLAGRIYRRVKSINPAMLVSSAVAPPYMLNQRLKMQNWKAWVDSGYVDALEPMIYVNDNDLSYQINQAMGKVPPHFLLYTGIAHQSDASLYNQMATVRSYGNPGVTLWYSGSFSDNTYQMLKDNYFTAPASLPHNDRIIDNSSSHSFACSGDWTIEFGGWDGNVLIAPAGDGSSTAQWIFHPVKTSVYQIFARWITAADMASDATYQIAPDDGREFEVTVNQQQNGSQWVLLMADTLFYNSTLQITLSNQANGRVVADAVRLVIPGPFALLDLNAADSMHLDLRFSRALQPESVTQTVNYRIEPGIQVLSAAHHVDHPERITLVTSALQENKSYQISINGLRDDFGTLLPAVTDSFRYQLALTLFEIDNNDNTFKSFGSWERRSENTSQFGSDYLVSPSGEGENRAQWWSFISIDGHYEISAWWPAGDGDRATRAAYSVLHQFGVDTVYRNQQNSGGAWQSLGIFAYKAGDAASVLVSNKNAGGPVLADAMRIRRVVGPSALVFPNTSTVPNSLTLLSNYPNPFNTRTIIPFIIEKSGRVKLQLFDTRGQLVRTLLDQNLQPGRHEFLLDSDDLASGVYLYRLNLYNQSGLKASRAAKMVLIR